VKASELTTPAQARLNQLKQQTKQAQQQVKRERAQQQLKRAKQAVASANQLTESTAVRTYCVVVSLDGVTCNTTINADGQVQAWKLAQHLYGKSHVLSVR
jgi:type VI protein secretion system component VasF